MTNPPPAPTLAERLRKVPTRSLCVRLGVARTEALAGATALARMKARDEVRHILDELTARGEVIT